MYTSAIVLVQQKLLEMKGFVILQNIAFVRECWHVFHYYLTVPRVIFTITIENMKLNSYSTSLFKISYISEEQMVYIEKKMK